MRDQFPKRQCPFAIVDLSFGFAEIMHCKTMTDLASSFACKSGNGEVSEAAIETQNGILCAPGIGCNFSVGGGRSERTSDQA